MKIENLIYNFHKKPNMIKRLEKSKIQADLKAFPAVAILGPRQVGKTTLAREITKEWPNSEFLDLERPSDLNKLTDAEAYLSSKKDSLICLDEIQLRPDLFPLLRSLIDEDRRPGRFLILGSSSPDLLRQSSESLAGRIALNYLTPFTLDEMLLQKKLTWQEVLWRGGFPDSILAETSEASFRWRENYIQTFLERYLRQFGVEQSPQEMRRLWIMCSHIHGQVINFSKLGQSLDLTHPTVKSRIDLFEATFMIRKLLPFEVNTKKRLVKSPKVLIRDSGLLCSLLDIPDFDKLFSHPGYGSCWEGFAIENILSILKPKGIFGFFRTHTGEEIDLVLEKKSQRIGFEFKTSKSPKITEKNIAAMKILDLDKLYVITPESDSYPIQGQDIMVMSLSNFLAEY